MEDAISKDEEVQRLSEMKEPVEETLSAQSTISDELAAMEKGLWKKWKKRWKTEFYKKQGRSNFCWQPTLAAQWKTRFLLN